MSKFEGFTCDGCGSIWVGDSMTQVTLTFDFAPEGYPETYTKDLCPACVSTEYPPPEDWIAVPPKRKRKKPDTIVHTTIPGLEVSV